VAKPRAAREATRIRVCAAKAENGLRKATKFDVALRLGQGYDDSTVMTMALLAASAASSDGSFVGPTFEPDAPRKVIGPFISPQSAAQLRSLMRSVVENGTATGAFTSLEGRISVAGKTGTADRDVYAYDRQGNPVVDHIDKEAKGLQDDRLTDSGLRDSRPLKTDRVCGYCGEWRSS
jgi:hypothetical protein